MAPSADPPPAPPALRVVPLSRRLCRPQLTFGAEVAAPFDLRRVADGDGAARVYAALVEHGVLIFRAQRLTDAEELRLARRFPHDAAFRPPALEFLGNADRRGARLPRFFRGGRYWHVDGSQNALPMVISMISAASPVARCGGSSTLFASGVRALELLPRADRELAAALAVRYSTRDPETGRRPPAGAGTDQNAASARLSPLLRNHDLCHGYDWLCNPLVRTHPETGRQSLWPSPGDMECFEDAATGRAMAPAESRALLQRLLAPGTADEHVYAHRWEPGDVVMWDNRSMIHSTEAYDYDGAQRHLHLMAMKGPAGQPGIPLRTGPAIAGRAEIRALWWGTADPRRQGGMAGVQTFKSRM